MIASCSDYREDLSSLLDDELEEARKSQIAAHLTECSVCRKEFEGMKSLEGLISRGMSEIAIPDIWSELSHKLPLVCEVMQEDLSAYIDGELGPNAEEGVNQHLRECEPCNGKLKELNETTKLITKGLDLPDSFKLDLWTAVKSRLNEDCALILTELSAYVDQEVATLRHRAITTHLLECANCHHAFDELSQVGDVIRSAYQPVLADDFDLLPKIKEKLQVIPFAAKSKSKLATSKSARRLYLVGAAAVIIGLMGSVALFMRGPMQTVGMSSVSAEAYLLEAALADPGDNVEEVVYESP